MDTKILDSSNAVVKSILFVMVISENKPLDIVNSEGVSLIHVFSTLDFSKYQGLEEYFLKNSNLLLAQMHTKDKKCKTIFYCEGVNPFHILATNGNLIILQKALKLKPEGIALLNSDNESPLHYSARHCKYETTKVLIDFKSDINKLSSELYSPLMEASSKGCYAASVLLLKAGASIELKNKDDKMASEIARTKKFEELVFLIDNFRD